MFGAPMDSLSHSPAAITLSTSFSVKPHKLLFRVGSATQHIKYPNPPNNVLHLNLSFSSYSTSRICLPTRRNAASTSDTTLTSSSSSTASNTRHWMVLMDRPPQGFNSKPEIVDYYVQTLERVLGKWVCFNVCSDVVFVRLFRVLWIDVVFLFFFLFSLQWNGCSNVYI